MENKKTEVDIILPNYNSSEFIEKTIDSVIAQTHKNWNLIIVDDCSDEKTKKILNKCSQNKNIQIVFLDKNKGAAFCRNHALEISKSEKWVAFLPSRNNDNEVYKKWLVLTTLAQVLTVV